MKETELYQKRQGRPYTPAIPGIDTTGYGAHSWFSEGALGSFYMAIYHRDFDGGVISEPAEFNDYLDLAFDGGEI